MKPDTDFAQKVAADLQEMGCPLIMRLPELSKRLQISRETFYAAIRQGKLRAMRFGTARGQFLIRRGDVADWLAQSRNR